MWVCGLLVSGLVGVCWLVCLGAVWWSSGGLLWWCVLVVSRSVSCCVPVGRVASCGTSSNPLLGLTNLLALRRKKSTDVGVDGLLLL